MATVITGSLAHDYIMAFGGDFTDHILQDQTRQLSVSFHVDDMRRDFGGTAGNIAYGMSRLGLSPIILATIGCDGSDYLTRLQQFGVNTRYVRRSSRLMTSLAFITTDQRNNQLTAFHPGAGVEAVQCSLYDIDEPIDLVICAPADPRAMLRFIREAGQMRVPSVFDPGQQIPTFTGEELREAISQAKYFIANDYEYRLVCKMTGWGDDQIYANCKICIKTLGSEGSLIHKRNVGTWRLPACSTDRVVDTTGAGDAYRAGFFYAQRQRKSLSASAMMGATIATYAVESHGTQNYDFTESEFHARVREACGRVVNRDEADLAI